MINEIKQLSENCFQEIINIRRYLHSHPELSFNELNTSKYIKKVLKKWNIPFIDNVANNGVVVVLSGVNPNSKTIALRADIDALPIQEKNEVCYRSKNDGIMHACGHDVHTASLLGTLKILNDLKNKWHGAIKFIFQPAEEMLPGGALQMINEGVLKNPKVDLIMAQHVYPELDVGQVGFCAGKYMASTDELHINVTGVSGHAALPEKYNNPILIACNLVSELENYFSKYRDAPSIFAIGFFEGLGSTNIIPETVVLKGTFRAMNEKFRKISHEKMKTIAAKIASKHSAKINFDIINGYPFLVNDIAFTNKNICLAKKYLGEKNVVELPIRMTAEDFAYYSHILPSCFYRLGIRNKDKGIIHGLHTSRFDIDEQALKIGMGMMAFLAINS